MLSVERSGSACSFQERWILLINVQCCKLCFFFFLFPFIMSQLQESDYCAFMTLFYWICSYWLHCGCVWFLNKNRLAMLAHVAIRCRTFTVKEFSVRVNWFLTILIAHSMRSLISSLQGAATGCSLDPLLFLWPLKGWISWCNIETCTPTFCHICIYVITMTTICDTVYVHWDMCLWKFSGVGWKHALEVFICLWGCSTLRKTGVSR